MLDDLAVVLFLVFASFLALVFGTLFVVFFAPVIGYYVWTLNRRVRALESMLPKADKPEEPKPNKA